MALILTANQQRAVEMYGGYRAFIEAMVKSRWKRAVNWQVRGWVSAEIVRSSWRAKCPFCAGAVVVRNSYFLKIMTHGLRFE